MMMMMMVQVDIKSIVYDAGIPEGIGVMSALNHYYGRLVILIMMMMMVTLIMMILNHFCSKFIISIMIMVIGKPIFD